MTPIDGLSRKSPLDQVSFCEPASPLTDRNIGAVSTMHIGMLGTMAQIYITDLRDKTRRGLLGRVLQGRAAGGKAFGYDVVEDDRERTATAVPGGAPRASATTVARFRARRSRSGS